MKKQLYIYTSSHVILLGAEYSLPCLLHNDSNIFSVSSCNILFTNHLSNADFSFSLRT